MFFSIIENINEIQKQTVFRAIDLLFKAIDQLGQELADFLQNTNIDPDERSAKLNALKMLVYAQVTLIKKIDKELYPTVEGKGLERD